MKQIQFIHRALSGQPFLPTDDRNAWTDASGTPDGCYCTLKQAEIRSGKDRQTLQRHAKALAIRLVRVDKSLGERQHGKALAFATYEDYRKVLDSALFNLPPCGR